MIDILAKRMKINYILDPASGIGDDLHLRRSEGCGFDAAAGDHSCA